MSERLERLINLTATLLETPRPLTLEDIADRLTPAYPEELAARRRAFERDKETLRDLGIPIEVETVDGWNGVDSGYRIPPDAYYLPDPGLDLQRALPALEECRETLLSLLAPGGGGSLEIDAHGN